MIIPKLKINLLFCLLFFTGTLQAQNTVKIDSIKNILATQKNDTEKVMLLNILGWEYLNVNLEEAATYEKQALTLSKKLNYKTGTGISLTHLGYIAILSGKYQEATDKCNKALEIFKETNDKERMATSYTNIANIYFYLSDYPKNIEYNKLALEISTQLNDSLSIANTYTSLGNAYLKLGDYPKALGYFMNSLRIYEAKQSRKLISGCYNNIAIVYKKQKDIKNAIKYYNMALDLAKEFKNTKSMGECYNNLGILFMEENKNKEALEYFSRALSFFKEIDYKVGIATVTGNIGEVYLNTGDGLNALKYFTSASELAKSIGDMESFTSSLINTAEAYIKLGKNNRAKDYALKGLEVATQINSLAQKNNAYKLLSRIFKDNNYKQSLYYLNLYLSTSDSLFNIEKTKEIEIIKTRYEVDKKESQIKELQQKTEILLQQNKIQELQLNHNRFLVLAITGISVLLILLAVLFINRQRVKNKKDKQIHLAKKALMDAEVKNITLEKNKLNSELEYRKKEVAGLASQIIEKNNLIEQIDDKIKNIKNNNSTSDPNVLDKIALDLNLNKTREDFHTQVEELHKDFFYNLSEKFPELTRNEKKLAALLRMELTSKDIASIMNISAKSVDMSRYRLRKKLNIENETNLTEFLKDI